MKNVLMKFAGLFVERVPVDEQGNRLPPTPPRGAVPRSPAPRQQQAQPAPPPPAGAPAMQPAPGMPAGMQPMQPQQAGMPHAGAVSGVAPTGAAPMSVALRAWVPEEYASHLAPFGVHVIAAGGSVSSEQARGWGADVLVVSAECLGQDLHLLQQPQLPTVFITPQAVMIPDVPGVVQVQEPLRASDVAQAVRDAAAAFAAARQR